MLRRNMHFEQVQRRVGCYVATSISSKFKDALDAMVQQSFQSTSRSLWILRCNSHWMRRCNMHFNQVHRGWASLAENLGLVPPFLPPEWFLKIWAKPWVQEFSPCNDGSVIFYQNLSP